jgi:hypothetical protein
MPVEIKKLSDQLSSEAYNQLRQSVIDASRSWGILTNFETIRIWDFRDLNQPEMVLETYPWSYIADSAEVHSLLAAEIFYKTLAVPAPEETLNAQAQEQIKVRDQADVEVGEEQTITAEQQRSERIEIAIRALSDKPSEVDLLGFADYATAMADFIGNKKTEKPLTIGIDAAWGMGKTTLMKLIRMQLEAPGPQGLPTVWFNAWKYDNEESLWAALVLQVLSQVRQRLRWLERARLTLELNLKRFDWKLLWGKILKYLVVYIFLVDILGGLAFGIATLWLADNLADSLKILGTYIKGVGLIGFLTALYAAGRQIFDSFTGPFDLKIGDYIRKPDYSEKIGFLGQFETDFKRVVDVVTAHGDRPLVIFIDDLDRCEPPKPVEIIEAINVMLDSEHCVFILGMDAQTVAGSIEAKYKDLLDYLIADDTSQNLSLGQRFLEKIIQINFRIPRTDRELMVSFIEANLDALEEKPAAKPDVEAVGRAKEHIRAGQKKGQSVTEAVGDLQTTQADIPEEVLKEAAQQVIAETFDDSEEVRLAIRQAVPYLGYNPRKIKRFINVFRLQSLIANRRGLLHRNIVELDVLSKWLLVATLWPDAVEAIVSDQNFAKRLYDAYDVREDLRARRADRGFPVLMKDKEFSAETAAMEAKLNAYLADPLIGPFVDTPDLIKLVEGLDTSAPEAFSQYLNLAQSSVDSSGKSSAVT